MIKVILKSDELLTILETTEALGVSRATVYRWLKAGKLRGQKVAQIMISRNEVEVILARRRRGDRED